jgi:hydroxymethylpyrimidine/phosphomethylpyrimidine kinase
VVLTIAGFDPSNGAGITADLQVFAAHGLFGTACITALTVQSTQGVAAVEPVSHLIGTTLEHLHADLPAAGIKIGMLGSVEAVRAVVGFLREFRGAGVPVVLDPVLRSSSGADLLGGRGLAALKAELLPLVDWITPNRDELGDLSGVAAILNSDVPDALMEIHARHSHLHVVGTGGDHIGEGTLDILVEPSGKLHRFPGERVETRSTHGTGCAFSSALLARLVLGDDPVSAVAAAKAFVRESLHLAPGLGKGRGPMNLSWRLARMSWFYRRWNSGEPKIRPEARAAWVSRVAGSADGPGGADREGIAITAYCGDSAEVGGLLGVVAGGLGEDSGAGNLGCMAQMLIIQLNGLPRPFETIGDPSTLDVVIAAVGLKADRVAVELNGEIVRRAVWASTAVRGGDRLEVVHFVGGGSDVNLGRPSKRSAGEG